MGFDKRPERLPYYLSGEDPILFDLWPELASFRDVVYLFKAMMCPSSASLPELKPWHPSKARLRWRVAKDGGGGDGDGAAAGKKKGWGTGFLSALGFGAEKPRAPPSGADPSVLCGTAIATEDDVLHVRYLPGKCSARAAPPPSPGRVAPPRLTSLASRLCCVAGVALFVACRLGARARRPLWRCCCCCCCWSTCAQTSRGG
jgi:hypothetical protein